MERNALKPSHAERGKPPSRLSGERNGSRSGKCLRESGEHHEVSVEGHPLQATDAERGESVIVLQASELALDGNAAPVQIAEPLSVASDAREEPTAESERQSRLIRLRACFTKRGGSVGA
jgi:hypothetical protein